MAKLQLYGPFLVLTVPFQGTGIPRISSRLPIGQGIRDIALPPLSPAFSAAIVTSRKASTQSPSFHGLGNRFFVMILNAPAPNSLAANPSTSPCAIGILSIISCKDL